MNQHASVISGLHHVTAMASDPQRNVDFYTRVLGLRLVKQTVNFDDPNVYHFYFGDDRGSPGSILTFFPWPTMGRGTPGAGEVSATAYACSRGASEVWSRRLAERGIATKPIVRFADQGIAFEDHDGMQLEIVESDAAVSVPARGTDVPASMNLRGFHSVTLTVRDAASVARRMASVFGMSVAGEDAGRVRLRSAGAQVIDLVEDRSAGMARLGAGSVHHVALRAADEADQAAWGERARRSSLSPTAVADRQYFKSIYFRDHSGVLFEVATDGPGFAVDEPEDRLGASLRLPPMYEHARAKIEARLPKLRGRGGEGVPLAELALHRHRFENAAQPGGGRTLLLLHGTGGDESDLLPVGRRTAASSHLLSPRGNVTEQGAARFFRRFAEGVFDEVDAAHRSKELARWVSAARVVYGIGADQLDALGYSNGANTLGAMLLLGAFENAPPTRLVLLRAMPVFAAATEVEERVARAGGSALRGVRVLMLSGARDAIVPPSGGEMLAGRLRALGAHVDVQMLDAGHELSREDLVQTGAFFDGR